jgi:hypothetical protein
MPHRWQCSLPDWGVRSLTGVVEIGRDFPGARALIGASAASQIGNWLYNAALLGYVYSATRSAGWVGAATICRLLPDVLLGPFGGAVADHHKRAVRRLVDLNVQTVQSFGFRRGVLHVEGK